MAALPAGSFSSSCSSSSGSSSPSSSSSSAASEATSEWSDTASSADEASPRSRSPAGSPLSRDASCESLASTASTDGSPMQGRGCFNSCFKLTGRLLGKGASGRVYECECRRTGKIYAVKCFTVAQLSQRQLEQLPGEVDVHSSLHHPNIARLEAVYRSSEEVHLVMEHLDGGDFFARLMSSSRGTVDTPTVAAISVQLLNALAFMHARGMAHRDLKPENVLYKDEAGHVVKLVDFGLSCRLEGGQTLSQICGTMQYVAPEVLGRKGYDEKCDIWSFGGLMYTLLTGKVLYLGDERAIFSKSRGGRVDFCPAFDELPESAQAFVRDVLRPNPAERPSAAMVLEHPFLRELAPAAVRRALDALSLDKAQRPKVARPRLQLDMQAPERTPRSRSSRRAHFWKFVRSAVRTVKKQAAQVM